jgi:hypothetical protein
MNAKTERQTHEKIVGRRLLHRLSSPADDHRRALVLQMQADRLNPFPKPRGFVFKAKSREIYENRKQRQANPRL